MTTGNSGAVGDARKREAEAGGAGWIPGVVERSGHAAVDLAHHVHPDAGVRELVARTQAEALREAADESDHEPTGIPEQAVRWYLLGQQTAKRRLRARADRLDAEVSR